ncbi:MAG: ribonuclease domain-containing protein [Acidovorax sp.]|jgi:ribonuclease T1
MLKAMATRARKAGVLCVLGVAFALSQGAAQARQNPSGEGSAAPITLAELPPQGRATYALIHEGGPFPYEKDGTVFGNRERLLPSKQRGYYREYTVKTPGARNRGARRIVCGGQPRVPDVCYYTSDHYASFREIVK